MSFNASGLSAEQLKELRTKLEAKRTSLASEIKELELILTEDDNDDKGAADEVDRSSFEEEMQRTQLVLDGKKQLEYEVQEALDRMDEGSYGVCEETEEPIGFKRLSASPWTRLSLEAQQEMERRRKNRSGGSGAIAGYPGSYDADDSGGGGATGPSED